MKNETWNLRLNDYEKTPNDLVDFYKRLEKLFIEFNLSISHEDHHGAFIIEEYKKGNMEWLKNAHKNY